MQDFSEPLSANVDYETPRRMQTAWIYLIAQTALCFSPEHFFNILWSWCPLEHTLRNIDSLWPFTLYSLGNCVSQSYIPYIKYLVFVPPYEVWTVKYYDYSLITIEILLGDECYLSKWNSCVCLYSVFWWWCFHSKWFQIFSFGYCSTKVTRTAHKMVSLRTAEPLLTGVLVVERALD